MVIGIGVMSFVLLVGYPHGTASLIGVMVLLIDMVRKLVIERRM